YGPHAPGTVAQIAQVVARPPGTHCSLSLDWEFVANETLGGTINDFLSIDVVNDTTNALITNVGFVYVGVSPGAPPLVNVPGGASGATWVPNQSDAAGNGVPAPAGFKRAWVDLSGVAVGTSMRIEISVGNDTPSNVFQNSTAFVDNVRLS